MEGYVVDSYKIAKRILEVQPTSIVIVVESFSDVKSSYVKNKMKQALVQCERVRMLFSFSLVNEEIVNSLIKTYQIQRIRIPNNILRTFRGTNNYSSLTDTQLMSILNLP